MNQYDYLLERINEVKEQFESGAKLLFKSMRDKPKSDIKDALKTYDKDALNKFNDFALANEDYEISQAIKEVLEEKGKSL